MIRAVLQNKKWVILAGGMGGDSDFDFSRPSQTCGSADVINFNTLSITCCFLGK